MGLAACLVPMETEWVGPKSPVGNRSPPGRPARNPDDLRAAIRDALDRDGPSLIEIPDQWRFLRDLATPFTSVQ